MAMKSNPEKEVASSSKKNRTASGAPGRNVSRLQQSVGNQALGRLLDRDERQRKPRLHVSPPTHPLEAEAERIPDQMVRSAEAVRPKKGAWKPVAARSPTAERGFDPGPNFASQLRNSSGKPLPASTRVPM